MDSLEERIQGVHAVSKNPARRACFRSNLAVLIMALNEVLAGRQCDQAEG